MHTVELAFMRDASSKARSRVICRLCWRQSSSSWSTSRPRRRLASKYQIDCSLPPTRWSSERDPGALLHASTGFCDRIRIGMTARSGAGPAWSSALCHAPARRFTRLAGRGSCCALHRINGMPTGRIKFFADLVSSCLMAAAPMFLCMSTTSKWHEDIGGGPTGRIRRRPSAGWPHKGRQSSLA